MTTDIFPSKILLFGEYIILLHSKALVMPFPYFSAKLKLIDPNKIYDVSEVKFSNQVLHNFYQYIKKTIDKTDLMGKFNIKNFESDISKGLYFDSSIPAGYGIGSSGALTAAIYNKYVKKREDAITYPLDNYEIILIKNHLAYLESFFHMNSSGIDPLVCYCNKPLLFRDNTAEILNFSLTNTSHLFIVLIDTKMARKTGNLVEQFLNKCKDSHYLATIQNELIRFNDTCINALLKGNKAKFYQYLQDLSAFQFQYFKQMIPLSFQTFWKQGLQSDKYLLKLCGSGGGGFMLGFTKDYEAFQSMAKQLDFPVLLIKD